MGRRFRFIGLLLLGCLDIQFANAQSHVFYISENPLEIKVPAKIDSLAVEGFLIRYKNRYLASGYAACNIDSIQWGNKIVRVVFYPGPKYKIGNIQVYNDSGNTRFLYFQDRYKGNTFDTGSNSRIANAALMYLENNGYPFAKVEMLTVPEDTRIELDIRISSGPYFQFDTLHIDGDKVLRAKFLEAYTGIRSGRHYDESVLRKANARLNQLPFLISERPPQIVFISGGKAKPYYYLKRKKSDQVNGIIGLAPSSSSTGSGSQNVVFTGEFVLKLNNLFKSAKQLNINWRSFKARSQELKSSFNYPYILGMPIGLDLGLELTKYDTLYSTLQRQVGFQYYTSGINGFKFFYQSAQTNLISVDTNAIRVSKQFPSTNAIAIRQYGMSANFNLLDYRFNPRKGFLLDATATAGTKTIVRDNLISEVKFGTGNLYDSTQLKTNQYHFKLRLEYYLPFGKKNTIKFGAYTSQISAPRIYFNELLREGGINSLKGFNEQSIFASNFNMLEVEYRFLFSGNSHFKLFWNGAYYEDHSFGRASALYDWPWGFGAGANIETGAGILSLMYALGKEKGNSFDLRTGKVHFGISSYF